MQCGGFILSGAVLISGATSVVLCLKNQNPEGKKNMWLSFLHLMTEKIFLSHSVLKTKEPSIWRWFLMGTPTQLNTHWWVLLLVEFCSPVFALLNNIPLIPRLRSVFSSWQQGGCVPGGCDLSRSTLQGSAGIPAWVGESLRPVFRTPIPIPPRLSWYHTYFSPGWAWVGLVTTQVIHRGVNFQHMWGSLGGSAVWCLPLARGTILESQDRLSGSWHGACFSLLLCLCLSLCLS